MMAERPSARYKLSPAPRTRAERQADYRRRALELFVDSKVELYSVEVARALGCRVSYAANILRQLERDLALVSRWDKAKHSGLGRRYFRLHVRTERALH
jgi:hypothetical protein